MICSEERGDPAFIAYNAGFLCAYLAVLLAGRYHSRVPEDADEETVIRARMARSRRRVYVRIFLLSIAEAEIYRSVCMDWFKSADCSFWLRSPGCSRIDAAHVTMGGGIDEMGTNIDWDADVRPVMWIDILDMAE